MNDSRRDRLVSLLYGELSPEEADQLHAEMRNNAELAAEWERLHEVHRGLGTPAPVAPPPGLEARILDAARPALQAGAAGAAAAEADTTRGSRTRRSRWRLAAPALGGLAALALLLVVFRPSSPDSTDRVRGDQAMVAEVERAHAPAPTQAREATARRPAAPSPEPETGVQETRGAPFTPSETHLQRELREGPAVALRPPASASPPTDSAPGRMGASAREPVAQVPAPTPLDGEAGAAAPLADAQARRSDDQTGRAQPTADAQARRSQDQTGRAQPTADAQTRRSDDHRELTERVAEARLPALDRQARDPGASAPGAPRARAQAPAPMTGAAPDAEAAEASRAAPSTGRSSSRATGRGRGAGALQEAASPQPAAPGEAAAEVDVVALGDDPAEARADGQSEAEVDVVARSEALADAQPESRTEAPQPAAEQEGSRADRLLLQAERHPAGSPERLTLLIEAGRIHADEGSPRRARSLYRQVLREDPESPQAEEARELLGGR